MMKDESALAERGLGATAFVLLLSPASMRSRVVHSSSAPKSASRA